MSASDHPRISTPLSASSSPRQASALSRPDWPWASASHLRYSQRNSSYSSVGSSSAISPQTSWDPSRASSGPSFAARHNTGSTTMGYSAPVTVEENTGTRQWTFMGFEWVVRDVQKLREYVEGDDGSTENDDDFEVLKQSPVMGDNKYKLEIARTHPDNHTASDPKALSLYVTSLALDFAHRDYEMAASMMAAIKCQDDRAGERGARPEWVWEYWQNDWAFRQESEVWTCSLPLLSTLLENPRILETDSLVISVQIHSPLGPSFPSHPSAYYVPKDLLDGLEASLDNPNTGDVRFICLERMPNESLGSPALGSHSLASPTSRRSPSSTSSHSAFSARTTARKRIIYAHSDIMSRRSDYFATMLASSFAENQGVMAGERKLFTIVVEEADFETVYWLLKYCYANWLLFKEHDDPRLAVEGIGAGWSARWLRTDGGEWDWKTIHKSGPGEDYLGADAISATSGESITSRSPPTSSKRLAGTGPDMAHSNISNSRPAASSKAVNTFNTTTNTNTSGSRVTVQGSPVSRRPSGMPVNVPSAPSSRVKPSPTPIPLTVPPPSFPSGSHFPVSPRSQRARKNTALATDPHHHPTPAPPPASALSIYQVAHRYDMPALANMALEHMLGTLTPQTSFALLLATSAWDELRSLVEDYVVDKWDEVNASDEFEQCCQEVSAGEWGPEGGQTLMALFRRLRSPNVMGYPRS